jgi:hypothetical protein
MLYFAPRESGSNWSALNKTRAENMIRSAFSLPPGNCTLRRMPVLNGLAMTTGGLRDESFSPG